METFDWETGSEIRWKYDKLSSWADLHLAWWRWSAIKKSLISCTHLIKLWSGKTPDTWWPLAEFQSSTRTTISAASDEWEQFGPIVRQRPVVIGRHMAASLVFANSPNSYSIRVARTMRCMVWPLLQRFFNHFCYSTPLSSATYS